MHKIPAIIVAALTAVACSTTGAAPVLESEPAIAATPETSFETERALNLVVFSERGAALADEAAGQWVLIAHGKIHGPWPQFDSAWSDVQEIAAGALHAFLYRAGLDDKDVEFKLSPFMSSDPCWTQIGYRLGRPMQLTMHAVGDVWTREVGGEVMTAAWGDAGARFLLSDPERSTSTVVRGVRSGLFEQDLTITEASAERLHLQRFEAPGTARHFGRPEPCRKVLVRLAIDELAFDVATIAYVLPTSITGPLDEGPKMRLPD